MESLTGAYESLTGCFVTHSKTFKDERGSFTELYKRCEYPMMRQVNVSSSQKNVVRGLHFQTTKSQGKLVRVLLGCVLDVVLDLRVGSQTFGKIECFLLKPEGVTVYIPPGFAHGFWALEDSIFHYSCTEEYHKESDTGICPLDDDLPLPWKNCSGLIISSKDKALPKFEQFQSPFRITE